MAPTKVRGPLQTRPEALGQEVVRLARRRVRRIRSLVGTTEIEREERSHEGGDHRERRHGQHPRMTRNEVRPPLPGPTNDDGSGSVLAKSASFAPAEDVLLLKG